MPSWGARRRLRAVLCTAVLLLVAPACGGDDEGAAGSTSSSSSSSTSSTPSSTATTSTTAKPATPEEEVEAAYLRSWDVYAKAVRDLDPSGLEDAYAKESLETVRREVERRARDRDAVEVVIEHKYVIEVIEPNKAFVFDRYLDKSVPIDPETREATGPPDSETLTETYTLEKLGAAWKVVLIQRET